MSDAKDIINEIGEAYDNFILRDLTKIFTGTVFIFTWAISISGNIMPFNIPEWFHIWFMSGLLLCSYFIGVLLQKIGNNKYLWLLQPRESNLQNRKYYQCINLIKKDNPDNAKNIERIVFNKHVFASFGLSALNGLISLDFFIMNNRNSINNPISILIIMLILIILVFYTKNICNKKLVEEEDIIVGICKDLETSKIKQVLDENE